MADLATPMAIRVAVGWGLPTLIDSGESTLENLARSVGIPSDRLARLLRFLAARDLLHDNRSGNYGLTKLGRRVLKPGRSTHWLNPKDALGRAELSFVYLDEALQTGQPTYERLYGSRFWDQMDQSPHLGASLDAYMEKNSHRVADAIRDSYEWETVEHLVDVGGGRGVVVRELLRANPSMMGTVLDLPRAAAGAAKAIERDDLGSRCDVAATSFFEPLPVTGATYLLSNVLHDWDDQEAVEILRRCAEAAGKEGRVLIVEEVLELGADPRRFTHSDLQMLVFFGGRERTLGEYQDLISEAGLKFEAGIRTGASYGILVSSLDG